ncbi:MAG: hypothetical protein P8J86_05095 [Phycisphaerales bacterium]|nr:hypothetical protein [Phycisphaerales bacterium]
MSLQANTLIKLAIISAAVCWTNPVFADREISGWKNYSHFAQFQEGGISTSSSGSKLSFEGNGSTGRSTFADNQKEYALSDDIKITFDLELKASNLTRDPAVPETIAGVSVFFAKKAELGDLKIQDGVELAFFQRSPKSSKRYMRVIEHIKGNAPKTISTESISSGKESVEILYDSSKDKVTVEVDGDVVGTYRGLDKLDGNKWVSTWFEGQQVGQNTWKNISIKNVEIKSKSSRPLGGETTTKEAAFKKTGPEKVVWLGNSSAFLTSKNPPFWSRMIVGGPKFSDGYKNPIKRKGLGRFYDYDGQKLFDISVFNIPCLLLPPTAQITTAELGWSVANGKNFGNPNGSTDGDIIILGAPGWSSKRGGVFGFDQDGNALFCIEGSDIAGDNVSRFGWSVHCQDVNNDGVADLIVGAPSQDTFSGKNAGVVYVLDGDFTVAAPELPVTPTKLTTKSGISPGAMMGYSVSACETVSGSVDSLVISSAPFETIGNKPNAGAVYVFDVAGTQDHKYSGANLDDLFGFSVSGVGDFNGDGSDDIAIGAPNMNDSSGGTYVYSVFNDKQLFYAKGLEPKGQMGWSVAGGVDIQSDGFTDITSSTPGASNTYNKQGLVSVYLGRSGFLLKNIYGRHKKDQLGSSLGMTTKTPYGDAALMTGAYRYLRNNKTGAAYLNILNNK